MKKHLGCHNFLPPPKMGYMVYGGYKKVNKIGREDCQEEGWEVVVKRGNGKSLKRKVIKKINF